MSTPVTRADLDRIVRILNSRANTGPHPVTGLDFEPYTIESQGSNRYALCQYKGAFNVAGMGYLSKRDLYMAIGHFIEGITCQQEGHRRRLR